MKKQHLRNRKPALGEPDKRGRGSAIEVGCQRGVMTGRCLPDFRGGKGIRGGGKEKEMNSAGNRGRREE